MPESDPRRDYPPALGAEECAEWALRAIRGVSESMKASGMTRMCVNSAHRYYGRDNGKAPLGSGITAEGRQGENVRMRVNLTRNLLQHILSMVCSTRPPIDPKAENTDAQSIRIVEIARAIADHYLKAKKVYGFIDRATEFSLFHPAGYVHCEWDSTKGAMIAAPPDEMGIQQPIFEGDCAFSNPTHLDLRYDQDAHSWEELDDLAIRGWKNRHTLAAQYPQAQDKIYAAPARNRGSDTVEEDDMPTPQGLESAYNDVQIKVWTYYHRHTLAVPDGVMMKMLDDGTVLEHGPMPYADFPLFRITSSEWLGTPHGHATSNDIAPQQDVLDKVWSSIATRLIAHGKPIVATAKGSSIDENQMGGESITLLECDFENGKPNIQLVDFLAAFPPELMNAPGAIAGLMEGATGVNAVVRGNPPPGLNAGVAINLFQSMAMQFSSPLEGSRARMIEDVVKWIFEAHRLHPNVERSVQIVGKSKRQSLQTWMGSDLEIIRDVHVDLGNPMSKTVAGRMQILQSLQQNKVPLSPDQALQVLNTGNLDHATEADLNESTLIREENERMGAGEDVPVSRGENHVLHIQEHIGARNSVDVKFDPALTAIHDRHLDQHMGMLLSNDPFFNVRMGMPPIPPPPMPNGPSGGAGAPPGPPPSEPPGPGGASLPNVDPDAAVPNPFEPEPLPAMSPH